MVVMDAVMLNKHNELAQVDCFSGCPYHGLDLFAHILISSLGAQPSALMQVSASASISCWMKVLW